MIFGAILMGRSPYNTQKTKIPEKKATVGGLIEKYDPTPFIHQLPLLKHTNGCSLHNTVRTSVKTSTRNINFSKETSHSDRLSSSRFLLNETCTVPEFLIFGAPKAIPIWKIVIVFLFWASYISTLSESHKSRHMAYTNFHVFDSSPVLLLQTLNEISLIYFTCKVCAFRVRKIKQITLFLYYYHTQWHVFFNENWKWIDSHLHTYK